MAQRPLVPLPHILAFSTDDFVNTNAITIHQRGFLAQDKWTMLCNSSGIGLVPGRFSVVGAGKVLHALKDDGNIFRAEVLLEWTQLNGTLQPHGPQPPAISFNGSLYICGGGPVNAALLNTSICETYAPDGKQTRIRDLPTPRRANTLVEAGGFLYCIGGINDQGNVLNSVEKLIGATWVTVNSMKQPRAGAAAAGHGDRIFVLGGNLVDSGSVEYYDASTKIWTMLVVRMQYPRAFFLAFVVEHPDEYQETKVYLYAVGGGNGCQVERLEIESEQGTTFREPPRLNVPARDYYGNMVHVICHGCHSTSRGWQRC